MSESIKTPTNRAVKADQVKTREPKPDLVPVRARRLQRVFMRENEVFAIHPERLASLADAVEPLA